VKKAPAIASARCGRARSAAIVSSSPDHPALDAGRLSPAVGAVRTLEPDLGLKRTAAETSSPAPATTRPISQTRLVGARTTRTPGTVADAALTGAVATSVSAVVASAGAVGPTRRTVSPCAGWCADRDSRS